MLFNNLCYYFGMKFIRLSILFFVICLLPHFASASNISGTIPANSYVWGENMGWINFGCVNCAVNITDTKITGNAWSAQYGWINLSPTQGGVTNDSEGKLGGQAWSSSLGWIDFNGVIISSSGQFIGVAGNQASTTGRINFNCSQYCSVTTDWRPVSVRNGTSTNNGGNNNSTSTTVTTSSFGTLLPIIVNNQTPSILIKNKPIITSTVTSTSTIHSSTTVISKIINKVPRPESVTFISTSSSVSIDQNVDKTASLFNLLFKIIFVILSIVILIFAIKKIM